MKPVLLIALFLLFLPELLLCAAAITGYTCGLAIRFFGSNSAKARLDRWNKGLVAKGKRHLDFVNMKIRKGFEVIDGGKK